MNRLHEKGYISNPIGKAKSVGMTEEGFLKAKELCERHFQKRRDCIRLNLNASGLSEIQLPENLCVLPFIGKWVVPLVIDPVQNLSRLPSPQILEDQGKREGDQPSAESPKISVEEKP